MNIFKRSAAELKNVRCLAVTGMLIAVYVVLKAYATVDFAPTLRITFAYFALAAIGMLYGPVVAVVAAIPCDLLGMLLRGGGGGQVLWGLTLVYMFQGLVYGIFLYDFELKKSLIKNVKLIVAQGIVILFSQLVLNTTVLYLYGFIGGADETIRILISARVVKNLVEFPVSVMLMYMILVPIRVAYSRVFKEVA
ncbi:MAG: folate family ECF transporter S component [Oscillospiraceae bacterium]|nr:folate family ECF transporter S component [Oscillospiraceae bacterium]